MTYDWLQQFLRLFISFLQSPKSTVSSIFQFMVLHSSTQNPLHPSGTLFLSQHSFRVGPVKRYVLPKSYTSLIITF